MLTFVNHFKAKNLVFFSNFGFEITGFHRFFVAGERPKNVKFC